MLMARRIPVAEAAAQLGLSERTARELALRGEIPGAAKIGKRWTFDPVRLIDYLRRKEGEACRNARLRRQDASGAVNISGRAFKSADETTSTTYAQTIQRLRNAARSNGAND